LLAVCWGPRHMGRCLFRVEHTTLIRGRGLVLFPGIVPEGDERLRVGDPILLKKPDGSTAVHTIGSLELPTPNPRHEVVVMLKDTTKEAVPIGTEVWSREGAEVSANSKGGPPRQVDQPAAG